MIEFGYYFQHCFIYLLIETLCIKYYVSMKTRDILFFFINENIKYNLLLVSRSCTKPYINTRLRSEQKKTRAKA